RGWSGSRWSSCITKGRQGRSTRRAFRSKSSSSTCRRRRSISDPRPGRSSIGKRNSPPKAKRVSTRLNHTFVRVMRGQKRVEDARERAYHPRIHLLRKKSFEAGWIAPQLGLARVAYHHAPH